MNFKSLVVGISFGVIAIAQASSIEPSKMYQEYPHAIVCSGVSGGHNYELIYYLTNVSDTHLVRYDSGNSNEMLHFNGSSGEMAVQYTNHPSWTDCVSNTMSLSELVQDGKALTMFSPIPTGSKFGV